MSDLPTDQNPQVPPPPPEPIATPASKKPNWLLIGGIAALVVLLIGGGTFLLVRDDSKTASTSPSVSAESTSQTTSSSSTTASTSNTQSTSASPQSADDSATSSSSSIAPKIWPAMQVISATVTNDHSGVTWCSTLPTSVNFTAVLRFTAASGPGTVKMHWHYSGPPGDVPLPDLEVAGGQVQATVYGVWNLPAGPGNGVHSGQLIVTSPNNVTSVASSFTASPAPCMPN